MNVMRYEYRRREGSVCKAEGIHQPCLNCLCDGTVCLHAGGISRVEGCVQVLSIVGCFANHVIDEQIEFENETG
jgi:hypothetical protein